jgi:orotidine-5'-phosphate decarboxylase
MEAATLQKTEGYSIQTYMNDKKSIALEKRIIFALDLENVSEAKAWVKKLESHVKFFKVGLQLFLAGWFDIIEWILKRDLEVMVDLKFFDVPETVASAVSQLKDRGATFATVHGNDQILKAAVEHKNGTKILAVTVLTSLDQADINELGFQCSVEDLVFSRAKRALDIGCDGVISSGIEAPRLRQDLGDTFLIVVPGVRPVSNQTDDEQSSWNDDQKRIVGIKEAFQNGADYIVLGRPIRQANDPLAMVKKMQKEIAEALEKDSPPKPMRD